MNRHIAIALLGLLLAAWLSPPARAAQADDAPVKKIAIISTSYGARSHSNAIGTQFFLGFPMEGQIVQPRVEVASLYIEQPAPKAIDDDTVGDWDVGERIAEMHGVKVYPTIAEALTLGGETLAVDGVLYLGTDGKSPRNRFGVRMYPHLHHLEQVFRVFDAADRAVPVFCDVKLAYSWTDSEWIHKRAEELEVPMMGGSVLPLTYRRPPLEHPMGARITEAVAVGHGPLDAYPFHVLEMLQCMLERRRGGETGVASVRGLRGQAVYDAADEGVFSATLLTAALDAIENKRGETDQLRELVPDPVAFIIHYRDGTRGTILMVGGLVGGTWAYAANVDGETVATEFVLHEQSSSGGPVAHSGRSDFGHFGWNIEQMFLTHQPQTPIKRTLLTSGILDMALRSLEDGGRTIETPFLDVTYSAEGYAPRRLPEPPASLTVKPWPADPAHQFIIWRRGLLEENDQ